MTGPVRSAWNLPAASPAPPKRVWRDWALIAVLLPLAVFEAFARTDMAAPVLSTAVTIGLLPTLLWRRTHPLAMTLTGFAVMSAAQLIAGAQFDQASGAYLLLLPYALFRWGSGRAIAIGFGVILASHIASELVGPNQPGDLVVGFAVLAATASLGVAFRLRAAAREREIERAKLLERESLARDLHDTVAHHVSAIAIRAQAGLAMAATDPAAAADALRQIETEASRTLSEMRGIVRALRLAAPAQLAPQPTIAGLLELAADRTARPVVQVELEGDVEGVPQAASTTVFRIAQEAVTNARRHARNATRIRVSVAVGDGTVRLRVDDDGDSAPPARPGYGLTGMTERAALLGGTCSAGPDPHGGWTVSAELPTTGWTA